MMKLVTLCLALMLAVAAVNGSRLTSPTANRLTTQTVRHAVNPMTAMIEARLDDFHQKAVAHFQSQLELQDGTTPTLDPAIIARIEEMKNLFRDRLIEPMKRCAAPLQGLSTNNECKSLKDLHFFTFVDKLDEMTAGLEKMLDMFDAFAGGNFLPTQIPTSAPTAVPTIPPCQEVTVTPAIMTGMCTGTCLQDVLREMVGFATCIQGVVDGLGDMGSIFPSSSPSSPTGMPSSGGDSNSGSSGFDPEEMTRGVEQISRLFKGLCVKNSATGEFCLASMMDQAQIANTTDVKDASNCAYFANLGCCAASIKTVMQSLKGLDDLDDDDNNNEGPSPSFSPIRPARSGACEDEVEDKSPFKAEDVDALLQTCGLVGTPACVADGEARKANRASWVVRGLIFARYSALSPERKLAVRRAIRKDIAARIGISEFLVSVGKIGKPATGEGWKIDFEVRGDSDQATETLQPQVAAATAGTSSSTGGTFMANVQSELPEAVESGATLGIDSSASTSEVTTVTGGTGAASSVSVSVVLSSVVSLASLSVVMLFGF